MKIEFEIDPIKIGKTLIIGGVIIGSIVIVALMGVITISYLIHASGVTQDHDSSVYQSGYSAGVASVSTATPTPTPAAITYPYTIVYQVSSATTTGGLLQVVTVDGKTLIMPDYNAWDSQIPRAFYSASVVSKDSDGRLHVDDVFYVVGNTRVYGGEYWDYYPQDHHYYYQNRNNRVQCAGNMICG